MDEQEQSSVDQELVNKVIDEIVDEVVDSLPEIGKNDKVPPQDTEEITPDTPGEPPKPVMIEMHCVCEGSSITIPLYQICAQLTTRGTNWVSDMHCIKCGQIVAIKVIK